MDIIQPTELESFFPILLALKEYGALQLKVDYPNLNVFIDKDAYVFLRLVICFDAFAKILNSPGN